MKLTKPNEKIVTIIFCVIFVVFVLSCNNNSLVGKRLYVLNGKIDYSTYYASLKELELNFIDNDKVETKMTMYADAMGYRIINDSSADIETKIYSYKHQDGILELPALSLLVKINYNEKGKIKTNEGEYLYMTSIISLLGTPAAFERVKEDSKDNQSVIFKNFLNNPVKSLIKVDGEKGVINSGTTSDEAKSHIKNEYNSLLVKSDKIVNSEQLSGTLGEMQKEIKKLDKEVKRHLNNGSDISVITNLLQQLQLKINQFDKQLDQLYDENQKLLKAN